MEGLGFLQTLLGMGNREGQTPGMGFLQMLLGNGQGVAPGVPPTTPPAAGAPGAPAMTDPKSWLGNQQITKPLFPGGYGPEVTDRQRQGLAMGMHGATKSMAGAFQPQQPQRPPAMPAMPPQGNNGQQGMEALARLKAMGAGNTGQMPPFLRDGRKGLWG